MRRLLLAFFLLCGCTEPIEFPLDAHEHVLVVEGMVTNEAGATTVRLSRTSKYAGTMEGGFGDPVSGALVTITDQTGASVVLAEAAAGFYQAGSSFTGVVGNTYQLYIQTPEGKEYQSAHETLTDQCGFSNLQLEHEVREKLNEYNLVMQVNGMHVSADLLFQDPDAFMRFSWKYIKYYPAGTTYVQDINYVKLFNAADFNTTELPNTSLLFIERPIGESEIEYDFTIKQYSISREAYQFWQSVGKQIETSGSIFDPAPVKITGNIYSIHDPEENVIGLFSAAGVQTKSVKFFL